MHKAFTLEWGLKIKPGDIVKRIDTDVAETKFEDNIVLLHIEHGEYYNFNATSSDLWEWLKEPHKVKDLANLITEKYDCTYDDCMPDIIKWLEEVLEKKLIQIIN